jgi:hypothetical protein
MSTADSFVASNSGTFYLTIRDEFNCPYTDTVVLVARANPQVFLGDDTTINWGDTITLDAGSGFTTYDWSTGESSQTIKVHLEGTYSVVVTNEYGCTGGDAINIDTQFVSVGELSLVGVKLYPVPADDYVLLELGSLQNEELHIEVIDFNGKILFRKAFKAGEVSDYRIDLSGTSPGMHLIRLHNKQGSATLKVLVR